MTSYQVQIFDINALSQNIQFLQEIMVTLGGHDKAGQVWSF